MVNFIIIDDEKYTCNMLSDIINWKEHNFNLCGIFYDGLSALEFIKETPVDMVITDISMPKMTGIDLAKELNNIFPEIYIIFISAYRDFEYARAALSLNVKDYIVKPICYEHLENTIKNAKKYFDERSNLPCVSENTEYNHIMKKALGFIEDNYDKFITLETISNHVAMNPGYFSTYFKNQTGEKFIDYLSRMRIEKAKEILDNNPYIKSIALCDSVGYKSVPYFYKLFKSYIGMTPSEYKEKILKERI